MTNPLGILHAPGHSTASITWQHVWHCADPIWEHLLNQRYGPDGQASGPSPFPRPVRALWAAGAETNGVVHLLHEFGAVPEGAES